MLRLSLRLLCLLLLLSPVLRAQESAPATAPVDPLRSGAAVPPGVVAVIGPVSVTWPEFVQAMADRYQSSGIGVDALNDLIRRRIIDRHITERKVIVTQADVQSEFKKLDDRLREATRGKSNIAAQITESGRPESDFRELLRLQIGLERMVAEDMKDAAGTSPGVLQQQWLRAKTLDAKIEMIASKLPPNAAARVHDDYITNEEFVRHVAGKIDEGEIAELCHTLLQAKYTRKICADRGQTVSKEDIDAEFERAKQNFNNSEKFQGLHFEDMIKQETGMSPEAYKTSEKFYLVVAAYKLGEILVPDADLEKAYKEDSDYYGPIYEVRHLFLRGSDDARLEGKVRTKAQAKIEIEKAKARLDDGEIFEDLVKEISEDPNSKFKDGFLARAVPRQFDAGSQIGAALDGMQIGQIRGPIESPNGFHIIKLQSKSPPPPLSADIVRDLRKRRSVEFLRKCWADAPRSIDLRTPLLAATK